MNIGVLICLLMVFAVVISVVYVLRAMNDSKTAQIRSDDKHTMFRYVNEAILLNSEEIDRYGIDRFAENAACINGTGQEEGRFELEVVRTYIKFMPDQRCQSIQRLAAVIRHSYPSDRALPMLKVVTDERIEAFEQLSSAWNNAHESSHEVSTTDYLNPEYQAVVCYMFTHMNQAPMIITIVRDRKVTNLDDIVGLLNTMSIGSSALSEGTL